MFQNKRKKLVGIRAIDTICIDNFIEKYILVIYICIQVHVYQNKRKRICRYKTTDTICIDSFVCNKILSPMFPDKGTEGDFII